MASSGVRPLKAPEDKARGGKRNVAPPPKPVAPKPVVVAPKPAVVAPKPVPPPLPLPRPATAEAARIELWGDLERLQRRLAEAEASGREARALGAAAAAARDALASAGEALHKDLVTITDKLASASRDRELLLVRVESLETQLAERTAAHAEVQADLADARASLRPLPATLAALLDARGVRGPDEAGGVLRALGEQRAGSELAGLVVASDTAAVEAFLEDRVALTCGHPGCAPAPGRAVLLVPPARCDVCGGSDIKRAVRLFENAVLLNGLLRITIVGGSPQYHRQIRTLITDPRLRITLIPGDRRRTGSQAAADEAGADAVIVWGATLLDHSLSQLYGRSGGRVIRIPHRGIARMLELAAAALNA